MTAATEFRIPRLIINGRGSFSKVGEQAALLGSKALIISDSILNRLGIVDRCQELLRKADRTSAAYLEVNTEPTDQHVAQALDRYKSEGCDMLIALGGGSCIDAAKAVSILASNGGRIGDYAGGKRMLSSPPVPVIAVPTTAGTGSEATNVTVIIDTADQVKMMIKHPGLLPDVALVDAELTATSPPQVTAATGIDALCHAVEAYLSKKAQPITDVLALDAIGRIGRSLENCYRDSGDLKAREQMLTASLLAGMAFSNASVTLVHGMSRPIGALFHVPHGVSNAMLLPAVLEFTREACAPRLAEIGRLLRPELKGLPDEDAASGAIEAVKRLCRDLDIPNPKTWGIPPDEFGRSVPKMAEDALQSGSPQNNPRIPSREEIEQLYHRCYDYSFEPKAEETGAVSGYTGKEVLKNGNLAANETAG